MLSVQSLGLHHAGNYLFQNVNFTIKKNDKIGLVGKNGAGKSTLLKMLSGEINFYEGDVVPDGSITIGFLKQDLDFVKGRTVWNETMQAFESINAMKTELEEVNVGLATRTDYESDEYAKLIDRMTELNDLLIHHDAYNLDAEMEKVLLGLGFKASDFDKITDEFSGGWRMRIELAKLLLQKNDIMLLDEPTNHLDMESIIWLENFLKDYPGAIVLVSHDKQFMTSVCNRTFDINNKKVDDYKANYSKYLELRKDRKEKLIQAKKNQDAEIKHTEELINKFRASASKAAFAQSLIKKLEKVERIEVENDDVSKFNIRFVQSVVPGKVIFEANKLGKAYGEKQVFDNVDFFIERGAKIALLGQNGQGKTTLAKILAGEIRDYSGEWNLGHNVNIGYFAQNQEEVLSPNKTVLEEAEDAATEETRPRVRDLLGSFLFQGEDVQKKTKVLSGGERNRLALCKLLLRPFNTLIMDEPTNHLDIQSKEIIKIALQKFEGTLILISHDREFLQGLSDKIFEFRDGRMKEYLGNIDEYLEYRQKESIREVSIEKSKLAEAKQEKPLQKEEEQPKPVETKKEFVSKEKKNIQNKISKTEQKINELESKIEELEAGFAKENPSEEQLENYQKLKEDLEMALQEWEFLATQLEAE
ncbi:ATP-binding cassette domain-containing protein [Elizabethkingia meningoseptica]|uniref:ABC-F family ATP-binding cassette domain-containing protein n=1 Tax=Elizabethkingia meningoseptica TaxID=238 RepID=UPI0003AA5479|nr:ABC-F family ATP-binding cassette domain-containing protein [Elizabethkingia meningoseptica]AQX06934.1 glycosyl transferase family 2 [Elizabethkingia meningoseptica]AQX48980.1 glycosyl transferase family 2 [Elizabethkingia meningoseptica]KUY15506.1 glycosyl transferase family 2 [Elizabethkingia meningoseptica]MDE5439056.1 ATP-binding cassette domain-containing protein [Elizabethkingia meningoseptica]MDE5509385.1 ATP-binding cassette domain-containing protein [Elizabethkingia meningoseptica]